MIGDNLLLLAGSLSPSNVYTGQLVTAVGATVGTNIFDAGPLVPGQIADYGMGESFGVTIQALQTVTSAGAATLQWQLAAADDAALTTNVQVISQTDAMPYTQFTAGARRYLGWQRATPFAPRRYMGLRTVVAGAALTNATGWLLAIVGKDFHDTGPGGRGFIFNTGWKIA